jgi:hypothetical protein
MTFSGAPGSAMPVELAISPEADMDIAIAFSWYEGRSAGLGDRFGIALNPTSHLRVYAEYRRCLVRGFPYAIYFQFGEHTLLVRAVLHTKQDVETWRNRIV